MEHIAAVLLMIACSDDLQQCQEVPAPTVGYETSVQCEVDMRFQMSDALGLAPMIIGKCIKVDPALMDQDAELVWDISPQGELIASVEVVVPAQAESQVAESGGFRETFARLN
jgi:hypothetical protein